MIDALPLLLGPEGYQISRSVRLRSSASAYLDRTMTASFTSQRIFTFSFWCKRGTLSSATQTIFDRNQSTNVNQFTLGFSPDDTFGVAARTSGTSTVSLQLITSGVFRDPSAWYHFVISVDNTQATLANRGKIYVNGVLQSLGTQTATQNVNYHLLTGLTYNIGRTALGSTNYVDGYLTEFNFIDGQQLDPSSFGETNPITGIWQPKRYAGTYGNNGFYLNFSDNSSRMALGYSYAGGTHVDIVENDGSNQTIIAGVGACRVSTISTANASAPSAVNEYLVITPSVAIPVTSSLKIYLDITSYSWATGRNLYINGTQVSSGNVTIAAVSGMYEWTINISGHGITSLSSITLPQNSSGRALLYGISIDGTTVVASANDWTPNNISVTAGVTYDSMLDVPTQWADGGNGRGNYCTGNPLIMYNGGGGAPIVPKNGNLDLIGGAGWAMVGSTIAVSTGKWYWEATFFKPGSGDGVLGIHKSNTSLFQIVGYSGDPNGYGYAANGNKQNNSTGVAYGASYTNGDVIGVALDLDAGTLTFYKNNTSQGVAFSSLSGEFFPAFSSETAYFQANFGQRPFAYTPPTGFKALNTLNLPTPTILKGNQYFDATTYTGNGSTQSIVNSGAMQPDLVWIKQRSTTRSHRLHDSVRGVNKQLFSDTTGAETSNTDELTAFNSDGFTLSTSAGVNANAGTYVGWQWKEGATQGFDIVLYTGDGTSPRNISHNLGVTPAMVIVKSRSAVASWMVKHQNLSSNNNVFLESTAAQSSPSNGYIQNLTSSSTFGVVNGGGGVANVNGNGTTYVAYLFAAVAGYSAFGSYTGNGSADGAFVFTGFRPRFIMVKRTDAANDWVIMDTSRLGYNQTNTYLEANTSDAEATDSGAGSRALDILSNGFKNRDTSAAMNANGGTYIFAAFAENPFKNALAR